MKYKRVVIDDDDNLLLEECSIQDLLVDPKLIAVYTLGDSEPVYELIEAMQFLGDITKLFPPRVVKLTPDYSVGVVCSTVHVQILHFKHTHALLVEDTYYTDDRFVMGRVGDIVVLGIDN